MRPDVIIAADTVVEHDGRFLEKAQNAKEAVEMLTSLSNSQHQVHTGVALVFGARLRGAVLVCCYHHPPVYTYTPTGDKEDVLSFHETTTVEFAPLSDECIQAYVATGMLGRMARAV